MQKSAMHKLWTGAVVLLAFGLAACSTCSPPAFLRTRKPVRLQLSASEESSGLACSRRKDGLLWIANDSGSWPDLYLAATDGSYRGTLRIQGVRNVDWEDLDSFVWEGLPWLLIADTGDNRSQRNFCTIHLLPEPVFPESGDFPEVRPARKIVFRYEDGPRDCEAVAADPAGERILLISKRTNPPFLYELPLRTEKTGGNLIARKICPVTVERPLGAPLVPYGNQPTGLTINPDGSLAAVLTYYSVFLFPRHQGESWATAFSRKPEMLSPHRLLQAEAITFSRDGRSLHVISEGRNSPIVTYTLK